MAKGATLAPAKARMRASSTPPATALFAGVRISVDPRLCFETRDPQPREVEALARMAGATVVDPPPTLLEEAALRAASDTAAASAFNAAGLDKVAATLLGTNGGIAAGGGGASGGAGSSTLFADGRVRRVPVPSGPPGPVYLLVSSESGKRHTVADMAALGARTAMVPVSVHWLLDTLSTQSLLPRDAFRLDLSAADRAAIRVRGAVGGVSAGAVAAAVHAAPALPAAKPAPPPPPSASSSSQQHHAHPSSSSSFSLTAAPSSAAHAPPPRKSIFRLPQVH
jgi:hypothetical protein